MLRSLATLAALVGFASLNTAQAEWNRRISDVRIVHPPGTPPGTWRVQASLETFIETGTPGPIDMSLECRLLLNGVEIGVLPGPLSIPDGPTCAVGAACPGQVCNGMNNGAGNIPGFCGGFLSHLTGAPLCGCHTAVGIWDFGPFSSDLRTTDVITVEINPTPGSLAEQYTGDDSSSVPVPDNPIGTNQCSGDGSLPTPCPCGNNGTSGNGCANSANPAGAHIQASGWTQADSITGTDSVVLHGSGMPATSTAIYLKGDGLAVGGQPFGDGVSCVGGSLIRLRTKINVGGASQFPEPGDPSLSVRGATPPGSGLVGRYAVYYRNAAAVFCPPLTYNISNTMEIGW